MVSNIDIRHFLTLDPFPKFHRTPREDAFGKRQSVENQAPGIYPKTSVGAGNS